MGTFLEALCGLTTINGVEKALRCQKAEHNFADTPCGIMDQYVSAMGSANNLLLIDCRSNEFQLVPFGGSNRPRSAVGGGGDDADEEQPVLLVTNSKVKHNLSGSEYPTRVKQCQAAVAALREKYPQVQQLRDATMDMLQAFPVGDGEGQISEVVMRRARHCILEDKRTLGAVDALKAGDFASVGRLMTESHRSLQLDYEVSCVELDSLVDIALEVPGVYGSRMTGGGFGGCTVTLVRRDALQTLKQRLTERYPLRHPGKQCECYEAVPSAGASVLDLHPAYEAINSDEQRRGSERAVWVDWLVPAAVVALSVAVGAAFLAQRAKR